MDSHDVCSASGVFSWNPKKTDPVFFFHGGIGNGHSFGGCKVVQANGSSIPCIQRFHNQGRFWSQLHNTHLPFTPENISSSTTVREQFAFLTTGLDSMAVSGEMKGHRDGDRTTSLSGMF